MPWWFKNKPPKRGANYFTAASLDTSEAAQFYFFLSNFQSVYQNRYLWTYIERDVIFSLLSDSFVIAHLDSCEPIELDEDIRDFYPNIRNQNGEYAVYLGVNDRRLITSIMEGVDELWAYGDFINLKAFPASQFAAYPSMELPSLRGTDNYKLNIQPTGDDIGFSISINPQMQDPEEVLNKIRMVLNQYHVKLEYQTIGKI